MRSSPRLRRPSVARLHLASTALALVAALGGTSPAAAQDVTVGTVNQANAFPFQQYDVTPPNRYQQVYAASAFGSSVFIDAIRFHTTRNVGTGFAAGEYFVRLSTTPRAVDGLDVDFDSNLGADVQTFFSGVLGAGGSRLTGPAFLYDPLLGNLLLDVVVVSQTLAFTGGFDANIDAGDQMSRAVIYNAGADAAPTADTHGLVTTFETRVVTSTAPEPLSLVLLGTGLAGLAVARGRRRRDGRAP